MKMKKLIVFILTLSLIVSGTVFGFAADNTGMAFTGEEVKLSLDDAKKMMLTSGAAIEKAEINLKINKAKTKASYEDVADAYTTFMTMMGEMSASRTKKQMADMTYEFAKEQTTRNYDAEINQIVRDTVDNYYKLAQAKEALRISTDYVAVQEKLYQNTKSKFNLCVVSKQDVLKAEQGLYEAKVNAEKAGNGYSTARMGFNIAFGFGLMQNVTITDALVEAEISGMPLEDAIAKAMENRNEIRGVDFSLKIKELVLKETGARVSRTSATYLKAAANVMEARYLSEDTKKKIEMDVRMKYMDMIQKSSEIELGRLTVANAKESYRLAVLQYDAGMATLTETQQLQVAAYQAELNYYITLLGYNLAIIDYEQSATVGTFIVGF